MKILSAKVRCAESKPLDVFDHEQAAQLSGFKLLFWKIDRTLTAVAHAEAGDLDAVQEILDQDKAVAQLRQARKGTSPMPVDFGMHGAKAT